MQTAFELYRIWGREQVLADWPKGAPHELAHLTAEQAREVFAASDWGAGIPRAELTDELAGQFDKARQGEFEGFRNLINIGNSLLPLREERGETEFWKFCASYLPRLSRADIEFAMKIARMDASESN